MKNNLSQQIEALLFATAEPYTVQALSKRLDVSAEEVQEALSVLETSLEGHAVMLVKNGNEVTLATRAEHSTLIEAVRKEELSKELSKASAETLAIIAYYPGVSKAQIEFIRGVNASYSIRALSMRGLIEQQGGGRAVGYYPTLALLEHFGVAEVSALPQYTETVLKIKQLLSQEQSSQ